MNNEHGEIFTASKFSSKNVSRIDLLKVVQIFQNFKQLVQRVFQITAVTFCIWAMRRVEWRKGIDFHNPVADLGPNASIYCPYLIALNKWWQAIFQTISILQLRHPYSFVPQDFLGTKSSGDEQIATYFPREDDVHLFGHPCKCNFHRQTSVLLDRCQGLERAI